MSIEKSSGCKVNLLLNIIGRRADGFHALETVMHPIPICDRLVFSRAAHGIHLSCNDPNLPLNSTNLVHRAAAAFLDVISARAGIRVHLEKHIPLAAGLGGGSGNAATTLLALNELFERPLTFEQLHEIAAMLGSDVPFFLQNRPALATGRGEQIQPLESFAALNGAWFILVRPGFGISTAWAYQQLARFPAVLNGTPGRAQQCVSLFQKEDLKAAGTALYNSLEAPALVKYPLLALFQEFFKENGAAGTLMSGSGSTTFALVENKSLAEEISEKFASKFGTNNWLRLAPANGE